MLDDTHYEIDPETHRKLLDPEGKHFPFVTPPRPSGPPRLTLAILREATVYTAGVFALYWLNFNLHPNNLGLRILFFLVFMCGWGLCFCFGIMSKYAGDWHEYIQYRLSKGD